MYDKVFSSQAFAEAMTVMQNEFLFALWETR